MNAEPQKQHRWLQKLVGEWTYESEGACEPGVPAQKLTGTESVRNLGDLWVLCEGRGEMPDGGMATMLMTLGYDPIKESFVGTWVGSMMTWLWVYDGFLDGEERVLTLEAEGPDFVIPEKRVKFRDVIELMDDGHRQLRSYRLDDDRIWQQFMTADYRRKG